MINIIIWILAFTVAITIHESAHAWMADKLGDPTPRMMGRLSLNPVVHYDPVGTTLLLGLVILRALGAPVIPFGWAKPVQFDPYNLAKPRRDSALISLAGPASNLILAFLISIMVKVSTFTSLPYLTFSAIAFPFIVLNVSLAIFNLIPVHPLDGGKILIGILPREQSYEVDNFLNHYGIFLLVLILFPTFGGSSLVSIIISPIVNFLINLFTFTPPVI